MSMVHENMAIPVTFTIGYWAPAYDGTGNGAESYHRLVGLGPQKTLCAADIYFLPPPWKKRYPSDVIQQGL